MAKKKASKKVSKSKPLKDFDIVAHTVKVDGDLFLKKPYETNKILSVYLNKYGIEIGYLLLDDNVLWSMDPVIYEEYLELQDK